MKGTAGGRLVQRVLGGCKMALQGLEGSVTDDVLHAAGVLGSGGLVHTQAAEKVREDRVALVDLFGYLAPDGGEGDVAAVVYVDILPGLQQANGAADAGLGVAHIVHDVDGTDGLPLADQDQDALQIHLAGFL